MKNASLYSYGGKKRTCRQRQSLCSWETYMAECIQLQILDREKRFYRIIQFPTSRNRMPTAWFYTLTRNAYRFAHTKHSQPYAVMFFVYEHFSMNFKQNKKNELAENSEKSNGKNYIIILMCFYLNICKLRHNHPVLVIDGPIFLFWAALQSKHKFNQKTIASSILGNRLKFRRAIRENRFRIWSNFTVVHIYDKSLKKRETNSEVLS